MNSPVVSGKKRFKRSYFKNKYSRPPLLVVVVNDAKNHPDRKLSSAENSGDRLVDCAKKIWGVTDKRTYVLKGEDATLENINEISKFIKQNADYDDQVIIYFCGHGIKKWWGTHYIAYDGDISFNNFLERLEESFEKPGTEGRDAPPKSILIITNFCYSFGAIVSFGNRIRRPAICFGKKNYENDLESGKEDQNSSKQEEDGPNSELEKRDPVPDPMPNPVPNPVPNPAIKLPKGFKKSMKRCAIQVIYSSVGTSVASKAYTQFSKYLFGVLFESKPKDWAIRPVSQIVKKLKDRYTREDPDEEDQPAEGISVPGMLHITDNDAENYLVCSNERWAGGLNEIYESTELTKNVSTNM